MHSNPLLDLDAVLVMMVGGLSVGLRVALLCMTAHLLPALWPWVPVALGAGLLRWGADRAQ